MVEVRDVARSVTGVCGKTGGEARVSTISLSLCVVSLFSNIASTDDVLVLLLEQNGEDAYVEEAEQEGQGEGVKPVALVDVSRG